VREGSRRIRQKPKPEWQKPKRPSALHPRRGKEGKETSHTCEGLSHDCVQWPLPKLPICNASNHYLFVSLNMDQKAERVERRRIRGESFTIATVTANLQPERKTHRNTSNAFPGFAQAI
jgi:hypothetical protein